MRSQVSLIAENRLSHIPLIMAVEDNEDNLLVINYVVDSLNCRFIGEMDGANVISLVKKHQPDLVLLDIMLPNKNGIDIFKCLREDSEISSIPVIAVTALAMTEDRKRIIQAGFTEYITKPYMLEDLEYAIVRHLRQNESFDEGIKFHGS